MREQVELVFTLNDKVIFCTLFDSVNYAQRLTRIMRNYNRLRDAGLMVYLRRHIFQTSV